MIISSPEVLAVVYDAQHPDQATGFNNGGTMLAYVGGYQPYVTWRCAIDEKGEVTERYWGHYHFTYEAAMRDFAERTGIAGYMKRAVEEEV